MLVCVASGCWLLLWVVVVEGSGSCGGACLCLTSTCHLVLAPHYPPWRHKGQGSRDSTCNNMVNCTFTLIVTVITAILEQPRDQYLHRCTYCLIIGLDTRAEQRREPFHCRDFVVAQGIETVQNRGHHFRNISHLNHRT